MMDIFPKVVSKYPVYFLKNEDQEEFSLEFYLDNQVYQFQGNLAIREIEEWIKVQEGGETLSDVLEEEPDARIVRTIKNREPIICLLDIEKDKSQRYQATLGHIAKKLQFCGGFADAKHSAFKSFVDWIKIEKSELKQSRIVYFETVTDKKYFYPHSLEDLNSELMQQFISQVKENKIPEIGQSD